MNKKKKRKKKKKRAQAGYEPSNLPPNTRMRGNKNKNTKQNNNNNNNNKKPLPPPCINRQEYFTDFLQLMRTPYFYNTPETMLSTGTRHKHPVPWESSLLRVCSGRKVGPTEIPCFCLLWAPKLRRKRAGEKTTTPPQSVKTGYTSPGFGSYRLWSCPLCEFWSVSLTGLCPIWSYRRDTGEKRSQRGARRYRATHPPIQLR